MADHRATYQVRTTGLWNPRHHIRGADGELGVLAVSRGPRGEVRGGVFEPPSGEKLLFRRDPGLLRGQFSLWTEGREWLGSSLRWNLVKREIQMHTGGRPLRLLPLPGFRCGWLLLAPKTGEMARIEAPLLGRVARIEVYRRLEFETLVFAYFLGAHIFLESFWPGPRLEDLGDLGTARTSPSV